MYKVFIDHKPIVICLEQEINSRAQHVRYHDALTMKHIKPLLTMATLEEPVQISAENPQDAFFRMFDGYIKIPAAGGIVRNSDGNVLLIKRHGMWDIPKGKIDLGESKEIACVREIEEECGITGPKLESLLVETFHTMSYKGKKALKHTFWYTLSYSGEEELVPAREEGITKVKWQSLDFMLSVRGRTYGSINVVIDAYVHHLQNQVL